MYLSIHFIINTSGVEFIYTLSLEFPVLPIYKVAALLRQFFFFFFFLLLWRHRGNNSAFLRPQQDRQRESVLLKEDVFGPSDLPGTDPK